MHTSPRAREDVLGAQAGPEVSLRSLLIHLIEFQQLLRWLLFLAIASLVAPLVHAQTEPDLSGRYTCTETRVHGKLKPCKNSLLVLRSDGRYEIQGREGDYSQKGNWLVLSDKDKSKRARIAPGHRIVFRYRCGEGFCEVHYERRIAELGKMGLG